MSVDFDIPFRWGNQTCDDPEEGGFTYTVRTHDRNQLSGWDIQIDMTQYGSQPVVMTNIANLDHSIARAEL